MGPTGSPVDGARIGYMYCTSPADEMDSGRRFLTTDEDEA
jgi:hypothetical protein